MGWIGSGWTSTQSTCQAMNYLPCISNTAGADVLRGAMIDGGEVLEDRLAILVGDKLDSCCDLGDETSIGFFLSPT